VRGHDRREIGIAERMTRALIFATEPVAAAPQRPAGLLRLDGQALVDRLASQLRELDVTDVVVVTRPGYADAVRSLGHPVVESADIDADLTVVEQTAREVDQPLLLCLGDVVAHTSALAFALRVEPTIALAGPRHHLELHPLMLLQRSRAVSVATAYHTVTAPNAAFRGVLKISPADLTALADGCAAVRAFAAEAGQPAAKLADRFGAVTLILLGLVRQGTVVATRRVRLLLCTRVDSEKAVTHAGVELGGIDEEATRLRLAVKEHDDFFATYFVSSYSPRVVRLVARLGLTPNLVTWVSVGFAVAAAACLAVGTHPASAIGALLLYIGFLFDCVDGQLARYTLNFSHWGGWFDTMADRAKEYVVYAGLAAGAARDGLTHAWPLAAVALALQTVRHMTDVWYGALQDQAVGQIPKMPLDCPSDRLSTRVNGRRRSHVATRVGLALGRASARMESDRGSLAYWLKRTVVFPIGERWVLLALVATIFNGRAALMALLAWGALALAYTVAGRTLRARAMRVSVLPSYDIALQRDDGIIARTLGRLGRGWAPPLVVAAVAALPAVTLLVIGTPWLHLAHVVGVNVTDDRWVVIAASAAMIAGLGAGRPHNGPLAWLVPAVLRLVEYSVIVLAGVNDAVPWPLTFALLGVIALFHYDLAARVDKSASPLGIRWLALGWDVRVAIVGIAAAFGISALAFAALGGYLLVVLLGGTLIGQLSQRSAAESPSPTPVSAILPSQREWPIVERQDRVRSGLMN
jgi:phosphatidylglycerophosphate synthase